MRKTIMLVIISILLLQGCAKYEPIIDTKGKSKFETSNASDISNDIILCEKLAKNNTTLLGNISFWLISPKAETQYEHIVKTCINNRGHSLLK